MVNENSDDRTEEQTWANVNADLNNQMTQKVDDFRKAFR